MISYAQNAEDVVLNRAFKGKTNGFYIDIGAWDPERDSVTKHFYDNGWRGINIEPVDHWHKRLIEARPRDVNLKVAVGASSARAVPFVAFTGSGLSSFAHTLNRKSIQANLPAMKAAGIELHEEMLEVEVVPLSEITSRYARLVDVDFLKIDVEGAERSVIESAEWRAFRPRVVLVEAVAPLSHEPTWFEWEGLLLDAGYEFALFDGLNRFYYRAEEPGLRQALSLPANILDGYITARCKELQDRVEELEAKLEAAEQGRSRQRGDRHLAHS